MKAQIALASVPSEPHRIYLAAAGAPTLSFPVQFAEEASRVFCAYRQKYQFGASEMEAGCGNIYDASGVFVGRISYNGRIWNDASNPVE